MPREAGQRAHRLPGRMARGGRRRRTRRQPNPTAASKAADPGQADHRAAASMEGTHNSGRADGRRPPFPAIPHSAEPTGSPAPWPPPMRPDDDGGPDPPRGSAGLQSTSEPAFLGCQWTLAAEVPTGGKLAPRRVRPPAAHAWPPYWKKRILIEWANGGRPETGDGTSSAHPGARLADRRPGEPRCPLGVHRRPTRHALRGLLARRARHPHPEMAPKATRRPSVDADGRPRVGLAPPCQRFQRGLPCPTAARRGLGLRRARGRQTLGPGSPRPARRAETLGPHTSGTRPVASSAEPLGATPAPGATNTVRSLAPRAGRPRLAPRLPHGACSTDRDQATHPR